MAYNELISLGGNGIIDILTDDANATASQILSGYTAYVKGKKITGSIPSQDAQTITPGTSDKTIASGKYLSGTQTIKGDSNLTAGNIKKGISIFGVSGTYTSDANAIAANILSGKTAYVNGSKITGSMPNYANGTPNAIDAVRLQNNRFEIAPAKGYHGYSWADGNYSYLTYSQVANTIGLTAAKIAKGSTILGISGTYSGDFKSGRSTTSFSGFMNGGTKTLTAEATSPTARSATVNALTVSHSYYQNHSITVYGYKTSWTQIDKVSKNNGTSSNGSVLTLNKTYTGYTGIRVTIYLDQGGQNLQMDGMGACYFT